MAVITLGRDTSGRPLKIDDRTLAKLRLAEERLGFKFTIVQGAWRGSQGAAASADTHDRGGVIDLRSWDLPPHISVWEALTELRRAGLIAFARTKAQGFDPHFHVIDYGNPNLAPGAARQVRAWENGRNGLASNGRDDGPRVKIPKDPPNPYPIPERRPGMNPTQYGRLLAEAAVKEWSKVPSKRVAVVVMRRAVAAALKVGPKR